MQEWRRKRLEAAAEKAGGKAALGRLLGYQDGSLVGQMLRGERPITEKTTKKLEEQLGYAGWFDRHPAPRPAEGMTEQDLADLRDIRLVLMDDEIETIRKRAAHIRAQQTREKVRPQLATINGAPPQAPEKPIPGEIRGRGNKPSGRRAR